MLFQIVNAFSVFQHTDSKKKEKKKEKKRKRKRKLPIACLKNHFSPMLDLLSISSPILTSYDHNLLPLHLFPSVFRDF